MKKLVLVFLSALLLGGCNPKDLFIKPPAGLEITTTPEATVFLNDENRGNTPFSDKALKPGVYTLRLVPTGSVSLPSYETKLTLSSKASTVISRVFTESDLDSSGYTLELQEDPGGETYLSIISDPDTINVTIDDKPSGFTPLSKLPSAPGSHSLKVTSPGYVSQELSVNTVKGYNLIVNFKLASQLITLTSPASPAIASASAGQDDSPPTAPASPSASATLSLTPDKPYVTIEETGTGWLRVRSDASATSDELGKANTGEKLKYLGETTESGWFKIEFEGKTGWVSGKYVTLVK